MTSTLRFLCFSLSVLLFSPARAAVPLINLIDENCPIVISVQDIPAFLKNGADSPWAMTWNDDQIRKFLAPLRGQMKLDRWDEQCKAQTGYNVAELLAMAKGQMLVAVTSADIFELGDHPDPSRIPVLAALELGENTAKVAKLIAELDEKEHSLFRLEDYAGVQLHIYQKKAEKGGGDRFVWAMADGIWFLSPSKTVVQNAIDHLKNGRAPAPLGESEHFLKIRKQGGEAGLTILCNLQAMYPAVKLAVEKSAEKKPAPAGLPPGVLMDALGLDTLRDLYFTVAIEADATHVSGGLTCSEQRGIFKVLAFNDGPVPQPAFVSEKWINASTASFSIPAAYGAVKELLNGLNPMIASMMQARIKELNTQLGIDLEHDLIGSLGTQLLSAKATRPGSNPDTPPPLNDIDQLLAFSLNNAPAFTKAIDALKRMAGPQFEKMFNKREYLGQTLYTLQIPNPQPGQKAVSYAITPKFLFVAVGSASILESAVQGLDGKRPTLWQKPEVKAALAEVPASACSFEYQDNKALIGSLIETLGQLGPKFAARSEAPADEDEAASGKPVAATSGPFDLSAKPDASVLGKYWSISTGYAWRDSNGLYFKSKVQHSK
ncbi:MAG: hypothetical protein QM715_14590 [Nibricoccus sp.]